MFCILQYTLCRTFFVASVPVTSQSNHNGFKFGIKKMEKVLRSFEIDTEPDWQLTVQCSSIGRIFIPEVLSSTVKYVNL